MPHVNELQEKFEDRGLTIVGVTGESSQLTEDWVHSNGAKFAYGYDTKKELARWFGIRGIPSAVLIDANGTIQWRGHPGNLDDETVEAALEGALATPLWEWPKAASKVGKALADGKYARALAAAEKVEGDYTSIVQARIQHLVSGIEGALERGDYLAAMNLGEPAEKGLKGLPEGDKVAELLASVEDDEEKKAVLEAQIDLGELASYGMAQSSKRKIRKTIEEIEELVDEHRGTIVEEQAREVLKSLRAMLA